MNWLYLIIHHTGAEEKDTDQVRRYHKSLGWRDIGYNFVIERNGLAVPGRPLELPGAHCLAAGMNTRGIGIALIGNLEEHPPTPGQVDALVSLLGRLIQQYHIPLENVLGHREVPGAATACPGRYFPLEEVRAKVRARPAQTIPGDSTVNGQAWPASAAPGKADAGTPAGLKHAPPQNQQKAATAPAGSIQPLPGSEQEGGQEKNGSLLWIVQAGSFTTRERAEQYAQRLRERGIEAFVKKEAH